MKLPKLIKKIIDWICLNDLSTLDKISIILDSFDMRLINNSYKSLYTNYKFNYLFKNISEYSNAINSANQFLNSGVPVPAEVYNPEATYCLAVKQFMLDNTGAYLNDTILLNTFKNNILTFLKLHEEISNAVPLNYESTRKLNLLNRMRNNLIDIVLHLDYVQKGSINEKDEETQISKFL